MQARHSEQGFVLVTSLVFLVVITLLAVSAINSSTIQERMASNQREKSRAVQAADATLRQGESLLADAIFDTQQPPGSTVSVTNTDDQSSNNTMSVKLWQRNDMLIDEDDSAAFLNPDIWVLDKSQSGYSAGNEPLVYDVDAGKTTMKDDGLGVTRYFVEDYTCLRKVLSAEAGASCNGSIVYRITSRATGQNPAAVAVTQSLYEKRY